MRSFLKRDSIALTVFLTLTCLMTNPLVLHLASAVEDKQDALLNAWIIAWVGHALITDPLNLFHANIFFPYSDTLAFSETMLPQGLFALPFNLAFANTLLGYNLVLLFSFFLAAYGMYLLVRDLTRQPAAAIIAGVVFAFNPYNLGNLAQVQLLSFGWMPLAFLYLRRMLRPENHRLPTDDCCLNSRFSTADFRFSFLFALFFSLQVLSSFYYAFLGGLAVVLYVIWFFVTNRASRLTRHVSRIVCLAICLTVIAIIVIPFFLPYLNAQRELGFERRIEESEPFSASLKLYTEVSPQNVLYGAWLAPHPPVMIGGYPLDNLFPGFLALGLGIVGIITSKNRERWFYFTLFTCSFLLSLGPRLFLAPNVGTDVTLPYRWLYDVFPLMSALRAPVRFDALMILALAVLAAFGAQSLPFFLCRPLSFAVAIFIALEYLAIPAANITPVPTGGAIPEYVRWLAKQPPGVILELPMMASDPTQPLDLTTQYLTTYHWHRTPDGYSGFNPPRRGEIAYEMQSFPGQRAVSLLQALGVEYVILHGTQFPDWNTQRIQIARVDQLQPVQTLGSDYIYRVVPRLQDKYLLTARAYFPNPAAPNQSYFAYVIVQNRAPRAFAIQPTDTLQITAHWSDDAATFDEQTAAVMPLVTQSVSIVQVRVTAPPRAGAYRLDLRVSGNATGEWNLSGEVSVQSGEPARQVVLPARTSLIAPLGSSYAPGETIQVSLAWQPLNKIDVYYSASVRVVDTQGNKIVAVDRQPSTPTLLWSPYGNPSFDHFQIVLPRDIAPGEYSVQLRVYQADLGMDALLLDDDLKPHETITLGEFRVK